MSQRKDFHFATLDELVNELQGHIDKNRLHYSIASRNRIYNSDSYVDEKQNVGDHFAPVVSNTMQDFRNLIKKDHALFTALSIMKAFEGRCNDQDEHLDTDGNNDTVIDELYSKIDDVEYSKGHTSTTCTDLEHTIGTQAQNEDIKQSDAHLRELLIQNGGGMQQ